MIIMLFVSNTYAQLYMDASANLPDNGAKGQSMDVSALDVEGDGDLDIILANEFQPNTILLNNGSGVFTKAPAGTLPQENHDSEDIAIADFNGDTHMDILFCSEDDINLGINNVHELYLGDGEGKFITSSYSFPDSESNAVLVIDLNEDGSPDVIFGNKGFNRAYINQGDGTFNVETNRLPPISRTTQDLAAADIDGDGDLDLFEGNENGNLLLLNDGNGIFTDVTSTNLPGSLNIETRKVTFGDVDHDGDQDVFLSNVHFITGKTPQNRLFLNDGSGKFTDATSTQLPADTDHTIDAIFEDVDLDGDPDIVVANVFGSPIKIYRNNGDGHFENATEEILGLDYVRDALGVIAADLNGDGLRDLYFCDRFMEAANKKDLLLLRNPVSGVAHADGDYSTIIYPNPISDEFFVKTNLANLKSVRFENVQGQIIDTILLDFKGDHLYRGKIDYPDLMPGIYVMHFDGFGIKVMIGKE